MRDYLIAGNWKMNLLPSEVEGFFADFSKALDLKSLPSHVRVLFAVPFTHLPAALKATSDLPIEIAAQNAHQEPNGAYTGEISFAMLRDLGVSTVLLGHSERRQYFNEDNSIVATKVQRSRQEGLKTILCIGEQKEDREQGRTTEVLRQQLEPVFAKLASFEDVVIAYEPVWAIGTGLTASDEQAQEAHAFIRTLLSDRYGRECAEQTILLYGGSAKPENIAGLLSQSDIDGGLVGGASLKPEGFAAMVTTAVEMHAK